MNCLKSISLVACVVLVGCSSGGTTGGSGGGSGGGGGAAQTLTEFCTKYVDAIGGQASTCLGGPKDLWVKQIDSAVVCSDVNKSVTANRATYDATSAQPCLTSVAGLSCTAIINAGASVSPDCKKALNGKVAIGTACYADVDCGDVNYCAKASGACAGVCKAQLAAGAACATGDQCVNRHSCVNSVCTANPADGTAEVAVACSSSVRCKLGLICDRVGKTCATPIKEGQACVFGHGTCEPFTSCASTNICVRSAMPGAACGVTLMGFNYENAGCVGSFCKVAPLSTTGTCTLRGAEMAACGNGDECVSGTCTASKCAASCVIP